MRRSCYQILRFTSWRLPIHGFRPHAHTQASCQGAGIPLSSQTYACAKARERASKVPGRLKSHILCQPRCYCLYSGQLKEIEKELRQFRQSTQELLQTIPGVGPLTSAACISEIQDIARFKHSRQLIAFIGTRCHSHINGIEGFWSFAKHGLCQYHGVSRSNFHLYVKEMEYRYNHCHENLLKHLINLYFGYVST